MLDPIVSRSDLPPTAQEGAYEEVYGVRDTLIWVGTW